MNFTVGSSIPGGMIHAMVIDKKNRIWMQIGDKDIGYMNADNFKWHPVKLNRSEKINTKAPGLYLNKAGVAMLIYQNSALLTYSEKTDSFDEKNNPFQLPAGWNIINIWQDIQHNYWLSTSEGLVKYNPVLRKLSYRGRNDENDPVIEQFADLRVVNYFYIDKENRKWVGSWPRTGYSLQSLSAEGKVKEWKDVLSKTLKGAYHTVYAILEADSKTWIYGTNLFAQLDTKLEKIDQIYSNLPGEYSIRYDIVNFLYEDREKNVWVATNKGLYRFNPPSQIFKTQYNRRIGSDSIITSDVTSIVETTSGEILVSTWGTGIFSYDQNFKPIASKYFPGNSGYQEGMVWSLVQTRKGDLYWGKQDGVMGIYNATTKKISYVRPPMIENRTIRQVLEDKQGFIWMGTQGGHIIKYDVESQKSILVYKVKGVIGRLFCDSRNEIWAGTDFDGLYRINAVTDKIIEHYTDEKPTRKRLIINGVAEIHEHDDSTMLFISNGINILNTKTGNFSYLFKGNEFYNLETDIEGVLWTSGSGKIISLSLDRPEMHYSFDERDGLDNFSFNAAASARLRNGHIVFGTSHNLVEFAPGKAMTDALKYQNIELSKISVNDRDLPVDSILNIDQLELGPGTVSISALFTTNSYQSQFTIFYMLEDMDKSWKAAPETGEVDLNYLPPGKYVLKAAVLDQDQKVMSMKTIPIKIRTPFYKTWWFFVIVAILMMWGLYWLDRQRLKRKSELQEMRTDIAEKLHREVNSALSYISILSEMALLKAQGQPEKAREFVEQIHDKSSSTLTAMEDMLWAITPGNDSMEMAAIRMQEFVEGIQNRGDAKVEMVIDDGMDDVRFDMQWRYEVFLLFKETVKGLLSAGVKSFKIHVGYEKPELSFMLQYSNEGCDMQQLNNFFQSMELASRVDALHGRIRIGVHKSNSEIECLIPAKLK
jgi:ligand-binding sensor domain-containing protein